MNVNQPIATIRRILSPRERALRNYAQMHDSLSELEQMYVGVGRHYEAEGAHAYALIALRAYRAELDSPEPKA